MEMEYYRQINANPHFHYRFVSPLLKLSLQKERAYEVENAFTLGGIRYSIGFDPKEWAFTLRWTEEGRKHNQSIGVVGEPCNIRSLSGTYVYYFVCPLTGAKCRILYKTIGGGFCSRKALKNALYPLQMDSHKFRYINYPPEGKQPYRRNGKEYYRGKLTPYGKRCQRYEKAVERQEEAFVGSVSKLLNFKI